MNSWLIGIIAFFFIWGIAYFSMDLMKWYTIRKHHKEKAEEILDAEVDLEE